MKNLVIGASGLVGSAVHWCSKERGHETIGTRLMNKGSKTEPLDVSDRPKVMRVIRNMEPEVIFFCAGSSDPDRCEEDPDESYRINVSGVKNVLDAAERVDARIVFISSAYIFDGSAGPYTESDTPNPTSVYGWHKLLGEHLIATSDCKHLIVRTSNVFGWDRLNKNSVLEVIQLLKNERKVNLPEDIIETPIYSRCLAEAILDLVEGENSGVYNIAGNEAVSLYRFGKNIASVFGLDNSLIKPVKAKSLKTKVEVPRNACLTNKKVKKSLSTNLTSTQVGLKQMLKDEL